MADILSHETLHDGSARVVVGTVYLGRANVVVPAGSVGDPALSTVLDMVSDYAKHVQSARRGNVKDDHRRGGRPTPQSTNEADNS